MNKTILSNTTLYYKRISDSMLLLAQVGDKADRLDTMPESLTNTPKEARTISHCIRNSEELKWKKKQMLNKIHITTCENIYFNKQATHTQVTSFITHPYLAFLGFLLIFSSSSNICFDTKVKYFKYSVIQFPSSQREHGLILMSTEIVVTRLEKLCLVLKQNEQYRVLNYHNFVFNEPW